MAEENGCGSFAALNRVFRKVPHRRPRAQSVSDVLKMQVDGYLVVLPPRALHSHASSHSLADPLLEVGHSPLDFSSYPCSGGKLPVCELLHPLVVCCMPALATFLAPKQLWGFVMAQLMLHQDRNGWPRSAGGDLCLVARGDEVLPQVSAAHCKQKDAGTLVLLLGAPSDSS